MLLQLNPGEPFRKVAMDLHSFFSSSTMETEIIVISSLHSIIKEKHKLNSRPCSQPRLYHATSPHLAQAPAHVTQPIAKAGGRAGRVGFGLYLIKAASVVRNGNLKVARVAGHADLSPRRSRMLEDVGQRIKIGS